MRWSPFDVDRAPIEPRDRDLDPARAYAASPRPLSLETTREFLARLGRERATRPSALATLLLLRTIAAEWPQTVVVGLSADDAARTLVTIEDEPSGTFLAESLPFAPSSLADVIDELPELLHPFIVMRKGASVTLRPARVRPQASMRATALTPVELPSLALLRQAGLDLGADRSGEITS